MKVGDRVKVTSGNRYGISSALVGEEGTLLVIDNDARLNHLVLLDKDTNTTPFDSYELEVIE